MSPAVHIEVLNTPPVVTMGLDDEKLYSGVNGRLNFQVQVGSKPLDGESMKLAATAGLEIVSSGKSLKAHPKRRWEQTFAVAASAQQIPIAKQQ